MPITPTNPFKGRHYPGEVIVLCVRWYLRYPLAYEHVSEILAERGVEVDPSYIWRWVQAYAPELDKRCRPHLKPTNKSYRIDETYIKVKGEDKYLYRAVRSVGRRGRRACPGALVSGGELQRGGTGAPFRAIPLRRPGP